MTLFNPMISICWVHSFVSLTASHRNVPRGHGRALKFVLQSGLDSRPAVCTEVHGALKAVWGGSTLGSLYSGVIILGGGMLVTPKL